MVNYEHVDWNLVKGVSEKVILVSLDSNGRSYTRVCGGKKITEFNGIDVFVENYGYEVAVYSIERSILDQDSNLILLANKTVIETSKLYK